MTKAPANVSRPIIGEIWEIHKVFLNLLYFKTHCTVGRELFRFFSTFRRNHAQQPDRSVRLSWHTFQDPVRHLWSRWWSTVVVTESPHEPRRAASDHCQPPPRAPSACRTAAGDNRMSPPRLGVYRRARQQGLCVIDSTSFMHMQHAVNYSQMPL